MAETPLSEWKTPLFGCCQDVNTCCYGFWCCSCLACTVSRRFKQSFCLPICDILSPAIFTPMGIPIFAPPAALTLRASIRNRYGIKGTAINDIVTSCFCVWCSWCQMDRELKERNRAPAVINTRPKTVVNVQVNPVMKVDENPESQHDSFGAPYVNPDPAPPPNSF
ncbi:PREDICTED: cornifelin homolog B-like [Cyprinodon variegatus]|uniref:Cornifelin homolog B-like n=1 Tax=Cyprinodon variegatus TaxID=28743 RepID=A0A3Q2CUK8_CYPVA|nr:PREDICTED: cornifelin homolog B-like [Cyprinodon variegatus]